MADLVHQGTWRITLRESPSPAMTAELNDLLHILGNPPILTDSEYATKFSATSGYTIKEGYKWQIQNMHTGTSVKHIWRKHIPPKAQLLVWFAVNNAITTCDNLLKRGCQINNTSCCLCDRELETVDLLLVNCEFSTALWIYFNSRMNAGWTHRNSVK